MADGAHVAAHALLVELDYQPVKVAAVALLVEFDYRPVTVAAHALLVEFDQHVYVRPAAFALLVEFDFVPAPFDVGTMNVCVRDILDNVEAAEALMAALVEGGTETARDWQQLISALAGYQTDIRECRAVLDEADVTTALAFQDGAASIRLWQWERGVRRQLVEIELQLFAAVATAAEIIGSFPSRLYAVKSGDTLQTIAARQLGDWQEWRALADVNNIDPGPLTPGQVLVLPDAN